MTSCCYCKLYILFLSKSALIKTTSPPHPCWCTKSEYRRSDSSRQPPPSHCRCSSGSVSLQLDTVHSSRGLGGGIRSWHDLTLQLSTLISTILLVVESYHKLFYRRAIVFYFCFPYLTTHPPSIISLGNARLYPINLHKTFAVTSPIPVEVSLSLTCDHRPLQLTISNLPW